MGRRMRTLYTEADRGRFDSWLVRDDVAVAYTDFNVVKLVSENFKECDRIAVQEFAEQYGLDIEWGECAAPRGRFVGVFLPKSLK